MSLPILPVAFEVTPAATEKILSRVVDRLEHSVVQISPDTVLGLVKIMIDVFLLRLF